MKKTPINIILVDDDEDDRFLFSEALQELNLDVNFLMFENGNLLLNYLKKLDDYLGIYIYLDLNMPILSGLECLKQLRTFTDKNNPCVTIYSISDSHYDRESAFNCGANNYLKKPNCFKVLRSTLKESIEKNTEGLDLS